MSKNIKRSNINGKISAIFIVIYGVYGNIWAVLCHYSKP